MPFSSRKQPVPYRAAADDIAGIEVYAIGSPFDQFGECPVHIAQVAIADGHAIDAALHPDVPALTGMTFLAGDLELLQLVEGHQPGSDSRGKVLSFCRAQVEQHLFHLQGPCAHIIHDHQTCDIAVGFGCADIPALPGDDDRYFQLEVQFGKMVRHAADLAGSLDAMVVGEIKYGVLIEFRDHRYVAVPAGGLYMLPERIAVATGKREGEHRPAAGPDRQGWPWREQSSSPGWRTSPA